MKNLWNQMIPEVFVYGDRISMVYSKKPLSQKEFLALEYHVAKKTHYAFRTPTPNFIQDT